MLGSVISISILKLLKGLCIQFHAKKDLGVDVVSVKVISKEND